LTYVYRAINSAGETIDFMLSPKRDAVAAKYFLQMALWRAVQVRLRVVNVDGHAANPAASGTKQKRRTRSRVPVSAVSVANKVLEQNHRFVKKRIAASLWFRSVDDLRTIQAYEAMKMIRKGLVSWLAKPISLVRSSSLSARRHPRASTLATYLRRIQSEHGLARQVFSAAVAIRLGQAVSRAIFPPNTRFGQAGSSGEQRSGSWPPYRTRCERRDLSVKQ